MARCHYLNSLAPGKFEGKLRHVIFKQILVIDGWGISCEIALIWITLDFTDDQSTLVQVMAWCRLATSHYLCQCWPRSLSPYGVTRPQWVNQCWLVICEVLWHSPERSLQEMLKLSCLDLKLQPHPPEANESTHLIRQYGKPFNNNKRKCGPVIILIKKHPIPCPPLWAMGRLLRVLQRTMTEISWSIVDKLSSSECPTIQALLQGFLTLNMLNCFKD